ncbi:nucleoside ABC transporter ATP-binding protein [Pseudonocardia hierapolitana]|uniref:Nucleoside ABC transporter ATP-binding protein n=1 Tax=Pseudonocardia hierapolitana TaxID=1128676 RepID=A0A561SLS3_9PSEU|nr:ATP-binding cassette domain-containing protein [Pseudonocardia hierapolitana]TWF75825.1 nucleoside ABC transporter ATP-binding protein [Pseudonocardia hierapolitana]
MTSTAATPAASLHGIRRSFGAGAPALDGVDLELRAGEVHALLGENGAGKTTLMRILAGLDRPDEGTVEVAGHPVEEFSPRALRERGVAMVQQHFTLVPTLTAGENLALARPSGRLRPGARQARRRVEELAERYGLPVRADVPVDRLSVGEEQRLEILRALDADARLLILDEPTAVLVDSEAETLLRVCRSLAEDDRAIVIITHRLSEVFAGCDRVTVLRRGAVVCAGEPVSAHDRASLATLMVGTAPTELSTGTRPSDGDVRLRLEGVARGRLKPLDLQVRAGEVLGVAGVDGNGQAELEELLAGIAAPDRGSITVDGKPVPVAAPRERVAERIAYVPADRHRRALAGPLTLADNLELGRGDRRRPPLARRQERAEPVLAEWDVRGSGPSAPAASLSGGNAQKLVLARELAEGPRLVVAAQPTRGLDPEAARMISERILAAAADGAAVVWFGAELDELFAVADRLVVLAGGRATEPFTPPYDRGAIGLAMAGGHAS